MTNDICGLNSVPIRCGLVMMNDGQNVYQPTLCLCNVGLEADENITCLGKNYLNGNLIPRIYLSENNNLC